MEGFNSRIQTAWTTAECEGRTEGEFWQVNQGNLNSTHHSFSEQMDCKELELGENYPSFKTSYSLLTCRTPHSQRSVP